MKTQQKIYDLEDIKRIEQDYINAFKMGLESIVGLEDVIINKLLSNENPIDHPPQDNQHPLVRLLMNYDNCPDHAVDAAAELVEKLLEIHHAAGPGNWADFMKDRSVDWFDEVDEILKPFKENHSRLEGLVKKYPNHGGIKNLGQEEIQRYVSVAERAIQVGAAGTWEEVVVSLHSKIMELENWKESAISILEEWEETWEAAGKPGQLGSSKPKSLREYILKNDPNQPVPPIIH